MTKSLFRKQFEVWTITIKAFERKMTKSLFRKQFEVWTITIKAFERRQHMQKHKRRP